MPAWYDVFCHSRFPLLLSKALGNKHSGYNLWSIHYQIYFHSQKQVTSNNFQSLEVAFVLLGLLVTNQLTGHLALNLHTTHEFNIVSYKFGQILSHNDPVTVITPICPLTCLNICYDKIWCILYNMRKNTGSTHLLPMPTIKYLRELL